MGLWLLVVFLENSGSNAYSSNLVVEKFKTYQGCLDGVAAIKKTMQPGPWSNEPSYVRATCTRVSD